MRKVKPFEPQEKGYIIIDNVVFDYIMPSLSSSAWKCLCFIIRKTKGWQKVWDGLSYSQIKKGTGIKSDPTVNRALSELLEGKYIKRIKSGKWDVVQYALNTTLEIEVENGSTIEIVAEPAIENEAESAIESIDTTLHETQETQLRDTPPNSARINTRSLTDLPEAGKQAGVLFAGKTNGTQAGLDQAEAQLQRSGWNIRQKRLKDAIVYCLSVTHWDIPPPGRRKLWENDARCLLDELNFPLTELADYYALAYARLANGTDRGGRPLTIPPHPGALTKTMEAIREERKRETQQRDPGLEWEWKT